MTRNYLLGAAEGVYKPDPRRYLIVTWEGEAGTRLVADADASRYRRRLDGKEAFYCVGY